jgi:CBS domain-containing protein
MNLRGVLTHRDIVVRCVAEGHLRDCLITDLMTAGPLDGVEPDSGVSEAIAIRKV